MTDRSPVEPAPVQQRSSVRVHFLMFTADGADGVCRSTLNLANHLSRTHRVEIISLYRRRDHPSYPLDDRVRVSYLLDARPGSAARRSMVARGIRRLVGRRPSRHVPEGSAAHLSRLTDLVLAAKLRRLRPGVLISTRPTLHLVSARLAPPHLLRMARTTWTTSSGPARPVRSTSSGRPPSRGSTRWSR